MPDDLGCLDARIERSLAEVAHRILIKRFGNPALALQNCLCPDCKRVLPEYQPCTNGLALLGRSINQQSPCKCNEPLPCSMRQCLWMIPRI